MVATAVGRCEPSRGTQLRTLTTSLGRATILMPRARRSTPLAFKACLCFGELKPVGV